MSWSYWTLEMWNRLRGLANGIATTDAANRVAQNLDGSKIDTGTVADARIAATLARLASPALTGTPTAPTAAPGTSTTQLSTTAFVAAALAALVDASPAALDTLNELAAALGDDPNFATTITNALALKAPLASPALTGTPTAPTAAPGTNTTQLSTTAFVAAAIAALLDSSPAALDTLNELAAALGDDPNFATTITNALALKAPLASPALTGTPTAPTPATADNDTSIATTAMVQAAIDADVDAHAGAADPHTGYLLESEAGGALTVDNAAGGVSTTSYATIKSFSLAAGKIAANGWALRVTARLTSDKTTGTFGLRILLNGVNVGEIAGTFGALQTEVCIDTTIVYTGATTGLCLIQVSHVDGVTVAKSYMQSFGVTGLAWGSAQTVAAQALRDPATGTTNLLGFWVSALRHTIT